MKTTPVCLIFGCLLACGSLSVAQPGGGARSGPGKELWEKADRDEDGSISRAEFARMPRLKKLTEDRRQALFDRLDKNGDGGISRGELKPERSGDDRRSGLPRIGELDKNRDGSLSFEEFQEGRMFQRLNPEKQRRIFNRLDSNKDGKITPHDMPQHRPGPGADHPRDRGDKPGKPRPSGLIDHLDKNGDGSVSFEEFKANPRMAQLDEETARQRYRMLDRNRDGVVDRRDIQRRQGPRPGDQDRRPKIE